MNVAYISAVGWLSVVAATCSAAVFEPVTNQADLLRPIVKDDFSTVVGVRHVLHGEDTLVEPGPGAGQALRCRADDTSSRHGCLWTIASIGDNSHVLLTARSRAERLEPFVGIGNYRLVVTTHPPRGTAEERTVEFDRDDRGWQHRQLLIRSLPRGTKLQIALEFSHLRGIVWFDQMAAYAVPADAVVTIDGALYRQHATDEAQDEQAGSVGGDLQLTLTKSGYIDGVILGKRRLAPGRSGGLYFENAALTALRRLNPDILLPSTVGLARLAGKIKTDDQAVTISGSLENGPSVSLRLEKEGSRVAATLTATNNGQGNLTGTIVTAVPIDAVGGTWYDDGYARRKITSDMAEYSNPVWLGAGKTGHVSRYPLAAVKTARGEALAWTVPLYPVRFVRFSYNTHLKALLLSWDLALRKGQSGTLRSVLRPLAGNEPFREALTAYYRQHAGHFTRRVKREGLWMPFAEISKIDRPDDFGFAFKEGVNDLAYDQAHNIYSFKYIEPNSLWIKSDQTPIFDDQARGILDQACTTGPPDKRTAATAVLNAGLYGPTGHLRFEVRHAPWASGAVFPQNPDPAVPGRPNRSQVVLGKDLGIADDRIDGLYIDNLDGWSLIRNFRRTHIDAFDDVPIFDPFSGDTCLLNLQSIARFTEQTAGRLRQRGKLLMANYHPTLIAFAAPFLDVMGQETYWKWKSQWQPMSVGEMFFRRALAGQKPYCLLQNTDFDAFSSQDVRRYFDRALAFGFWPGMFSHDAYHDHYFAKREYYNRDRDAFKQTVGLLRQLTRAGWQAVRSAEVSPAELLVCERFGDNEDIFWTVYNPTDQTVHFSLHPTGNLRDRLTQAHALTDCKAFKSHGAPVERISGTVAAGRTVVVSAKRKRS